MKKRYDVIVVLLFVVFLISIVSGHGGVGLKDGNEIAAGEGGGAGIELDPKKHGPQKYIVIKTYNNFISSPNWQNQDIVEIMNDMDDFFKKNSYNQLQIVGADGGEFNEDDIYGSYQLNLAEECDSRIFNDAVFETSKNDINYFDGLNVIILFNGYCGEWKESFHLRGSTYVYNGETINLNIGSILDVRPDIIGLNGKKFKGIGHEMAHMHMNNQGHSNYRDRLYDPSTSLEDTSTFVRTGDPYDILGLGAHYKLGHSNARQLVYATWLREEGDQRYLLVNENNLPEDKTFKLKSISNSESGLKALLIPYGNIRGSMQYLFVEWHEPMGLDLEILERKPEIESNIFDGALLHINEIVESTLFNPINLQGGFDCTLNYNENTKYYSYIPEQCPRVFKTALPFGDSYTDPNTGTVISIGEGPEEGGELEVKVELGRTDFTPPVIEDIIVDYNTGDDCTALVSVEAYDPGYDVGDEDRGISRVEFYRGVSGSLTKTGDLIYRDEEAPWEFTYDKKNIVDNPYPNLIRVFDNSGEEIGIALENYAQVTYNRYNEINRNSISQCNFGITEIEIDFPHIESTFSTLQLSPISERRQHYSFQTPPLFLRSPLPIKLLFNGPTIQSAKFEQINDCFDNPESRFFVRRDHLGHVRSFQGDVCNRIEFTFLPTEIPYIMDYTGDKSLLLEPGFNEFWIDGRMSPSEPATILYIPFFVLPSNLFIRGDSNSDSNVDISDAIYLFNYLFIGEVDKPECMDGADVNDDGRVDLSDGIFILNFLFQGGELPSAPFDRVGGEFIPGTDQTYDELDCGESDIESDMHTECSNEQCIAVIGKGDNECTNPFECQTCIDSDVSEEFPDGINYYERGGRFNENDDYCIDQTNLMEMNCVSEDYQSIFDCSSLGEYSTCYEGKCIQRCIDSDVSEEFPDGKNFFLRGIVERERYGILDEDKCGEGNNNIIENYCSDDQRWNSEIGRCSDSCVDGACTGSCVDTETGERYWKNGRVYLSDGSIVDDDCLDDNILIEASCGDEGELLIRNVNCPQGRICTEGKCINPNED
jgi:hypothetical protein